MKYRMLVSFILLGCHGTSAMRKVLHQGTSKAHEDFTATQFLLTNTAHEGIVEVYPRILDDLFPPGEEDLPLFHPTETHEGGLLFDTLFSAKATIDDIKRLSVEEQAARSLELKNVTELSLEK